MKQKPKPHTTTSKSARNTGATKHKAPREGAGKQGRRNSDLEKVLELIKEWPGIRPSAINRILNRDQSDNLRATLVKRGLVRKEKHGSTVRYYPAQ
jgi:hypothetical protein